MALGTGIALLPESALAFAAAKVPSGAATASMLLLLLLVPSFVSAQSADATRAVLRKQLRGDPLHLRLPPADERLSDGTELPRTGRAAVKLDKYVGDGMDRDQVLAAFAVDYGTQAILARPIDKGFNRLAWLFPYLIGVSGAVGAVVIARRWSRRSSPQILGRRAAGGCGPPHPGWTMSSATSINSTDAEGLPRSGEKDAPSATFDRLRVVRSLVEGGHARPWHFFVLVSLMAAPPPWSWPGRPGPSTSF